MVYNIPIDLDDEVEAAIKADAQAHGETVEEWLSEFVRIYAFTNMWEIEGKGNGMEELADVVERYRRSK